MGVYNQRKGDMVNRLVGTMREATNLCNGYVSPSLPPRLSEKEGFMNQQGNIQLIVVIICL